MKGIRNGRIYKDGQFVEGQVLIYEKTIVAIQPVDQPTEAEIDWIDAKGAYVLPGFIDVHIHGYKGRDVMDGDEEGIKVISQNILENGVTSFLPTTMTMDMEKIEQAIESVKKVQSNQTTGARILGVHMEGPFINPAYKGAQSAEAIILPTEALVERHKDMIKVITIAPEIEGAMGMIKKYANKINFSIGHTGADYETTIEAIEMGAKSTTHLFNAMTGLHHRNPGVVGAALTSSCYSELIADKIHVHPALFELLGKTKGLDKLLLITDCIQGGGLEEGTYDLGGQEVTVKDGKCTLADGTIAGSVLKLIHGLKTYTESVSYKLEELIPLVTMNQAKYLKVEETIGSLDTGKDADMVIMDEKFIVKKTIVKGRCEYEL